MCLWKGGWGRGLTFRAFSQRLKLWRMGGKFWSNSGRKMEMLLPLTFPRNGSVWGAFDELKMKNTAFVQWKVRGPLESFNQKFMLKLTGGGGVDPVCTMGANLDYTEQTGTAPLTLPCTWLRGGQRIRAQQWKLRGSQSDTVGLLKGETVELWHAPICSCWWNDEAEKAEWRWCQNRKDRKQ